MSVTINHIIFINFLQQKIISVCCSKSTWIPLLLRKDLKSAIFRSPTSTDLCGGGEVEIGNKDSMPLSVFPTSASTQAIS